MTSPSLVDSHCHLNYDYAPKSTDDLLREATQDGVSHFVTVGVDFETLPVLEKISASYPNVFHTVGLHPHDAIKWTTENEETIRQAAQNPKCRAIGEIGLDYHYDHSDRETQLRVLDRQLALALELNLPIVVHAREAEADLLPKLAGYAKLADRAKAERGAVGAIHCFTGTMEFGRACLDLGFLISFSGILTFKKATDLHECAKEFPLERLMVETDSPYLAPIPFRGKKCEPAMVKLTAMKVAELKNVPFESVAKATSANAKRLFAITT